MVKDTGLAAIAYLLGLITGIIVFVISEPKDKFARFHAVQSILFHVAVMVIGFVIGIAMVPFAMLSAGTASPPVFMWFWGLWSVWAFYFIVVFIVWVVLMIRAYSGQKYKLPVLGDLAEEWTK
ncbi:MAG: DUF4870 domain-containing protein [Candidatus Aenigmarchaeota archaeon]|nr:DUF4870 domain-containing protein [Candidatus Aenigmarchaeota archaeon]